MASSKSAVEHVVFFKVKPDAAEENKTTMMARLSALSCLPGVCQLSVGPTVLAPTHPAHGREGEWTHALYGRYDSKDALKVYSGSAEHVAVVAESVRPNISDLVAVDWETWLQPGEALSDPEATVFHVVLLELKDGVSEEQVDAMVKGLKGHQGSIPCVRQISMGQNFAPDRAKGFTWGFLASFKDVEALKQYASHPEHMSVMTTSVFPIVKRYTSCDFQLFSRL